MGNEESTTAGKASGGEQASSHPKGAVVRGRITVQMVQNVLLIWLDNKIDDTSADCRNTISQLRRAVNDINTFTDGDECIQFIENITDNKACMIISGVLGQHIVPRVHDMSQVDSIFIFCGNKKYHEEWANKWSKIKGVFTDIIPICEALKKAAQQCEQNAISMSFVATSGDQSQKKLDQLEPSFMYTQILKEILLTIKFEQQHIIEFIAHCRIVLADNDTELKNVKKLERNYCDETPIWWYTFECFLYPMLNRALRKMDVDVIIKMGFFIVDLHRHIEQLHKKQFGNGKSNKNFNVYRGQGMSTTEFEQMTKTKGGLISFNNFLSTSQNRDISLKFACGALSNPDLVGVLFVMTIDPSQFTTPFASVADVGCYGDREKEVLFAMHTVFRIGEMTPMGGNQRLVQVELTLTDENDKDLRLLTDRIQQETFPEEEGWFRLGKLLLTLHQPKKAEQVYRILLEQTTDASKRGSLYRHLGNAKFYQGEYQEAIIFYEKALEIYKKTLPPNHPDLGGSYNNIGLVYDNMGDYSKALSFHEKALAIRQQSLPPNHPDLGSSYNNIGLVYDSMGDYSKALSYYEKDLEISQKSLPPNHPDLAKSYIAHGLVYNKMGEHSKAIVFYEKALAIQQQSLPLNHPDLAKSYIAHGLVYNEMGEHSKAIVFYEKALAIQQQPHPPNHSDLGMSYNSIGGLYGQMREYAKALPYFEKALAIQQQSLPANHPDLAKSYKNIGNVYSMMGDYSKALSYYEKDLEISQKSLPPNHPDLAKSYIAHGNVYNKMGEHSKAIVFYEKALAIQQQSLPPNHPDLGMSYNNIGVVYKNMGDYSKARSFYERAVEIGQLSLPANHPDLRDYRNNLEDMKKKL